MTTANRNKRKSYKALIATAHILHLRVFWLQIESLSASVRQLEMERNSLFQHLQELKKENEVIRQTSDDVRASSVSFSQLETSFNQLQARQSKLFSFFFRILFQDQFVRVMREKAELSDDVQRMEHVIMQLEGETETIGKCETESDGEGPRNQKCLR